ncbi:MAG: DUF2225 domain-containing protein [Clostridiales Family XIII bacterium]|jgi:uncharacterized protein (DUF2225 family)/CRP-like cAMP-binding protein|nr:DUF2225 domain-containing protein [Clostridiales Family XIII bacterium]
MEINTLLKLSGIKRYLQGQVIAREDDASNEGMYIVLQGSAGAFKNYQMLNEKQTTSYEAGSFFGEMSLFIGQKRDFTVVALTEMVVIEVTRMNAYELFMTQPEITFSLFKGLCQKLNSVASSYLTLHAETRKETSALGLAVSGSSPIFPEEHGNYILPIDNGLSDYLFADTVKCPMCGNVFKNLSVLESKLIQESKDDDMRIRYKGIEPMYYEVITCPVCLYSAISDLFKEIEVTKRMVEALNDVMTPYRGDIEIKAGAERDTFTVFASYYLAILSAPVCFYEHQRITARLWRNLSRIYDDCSDENMQAYALKRSLDEYNYSYTHFDIGGKNLQQLCYVIGELYFKLGDYEQARRFLYAAFTNKEGSPVIKRQAEDRLDEAKALMQELQP